MNYDGKAFPMLMFTLVVTTLCRPENYVQRMQYTVILDLVWVMDKNIKTHECGSLKY